MKFRYKKFGIGIVRPVIPIGVTYKDRSVQYEVLVDSGADFCIFDAQIGEVLGINVEKGKKESVGGITGTVESYYVHPVVLDVGGVIFPVHVGFLKNVAPLGYGVVGQNGFFDHFVVKFNRFKEEVELFQYQNE